MKSRIVSLALTASLLAGCSTSYTMTPTPLANQSIRYDRGSPTTLDDRPSGTVQMTPLGVNKDGRLTFGVAVFNKGTSSSNFGIENVTLADAGGISIKVYSRDELAHEAKVKQEWATALAILAGAAAAYAASQNAYHTTNGFISGPYGTTTFSASTYDPGAAVAGGAIAGAATGYAIASINHAMDQTLDHLNGSILQTTTVDPGVSFGGEVDGDMPKGKDLPQDVTVRATWNGENYDFRYTIAKLK